MIPVKTWLSLAEACAYMDMSINTFKSTESENGLSVAQIKNKLYYNVSELNQLLGDSVIIKSTYQSY